jgi:hypothetical protein
MKELEQLEFASMTVDGWSSVANDPYFGIKIYSITFKIILFYNY